MSWTYDPELVASVPLFELRLKIGDTREDDQQLQDEELDMLLDSASGVDAAALAAARVLRAKYSRYVDKWVGDLKILASQRLRAYERLIEELEGPAGFYGRPYAGGIRVSDKDATVADTDLVTPAFRRNMHDNPGTCD